MKNLSTPIKLSVSLATLMLSHASFAAGTTAGEVVSNTATISYSVNNVVQAPIASAAALFTVDRKVDLTVTGNSNGSTVVPSSDHTVASNTLKYVLSNDGNDQQDFKVNVSHLSSDQFDAGEGTTTSPTTPQVCQFVIKDQAATPAVIGALKDIEAGAIQNSTIVTLAKDEKATIEVTCSMPNRPDVVDGDTSTLEVLATAVDGSGAIMQETAGADQKDVIDVVLADGTGAAADGADRNAMHSAIETYEIDVPMLEVAKTSAVTWDPFNLAVNPKRIPGAKVEYTIAIKNTSDTAAAGVVITDELVGVTSGFVEFSGVGTINIDGTPAGAAGTFGTVGTTANVVQVTGIAVPGNSTVNVTFEVEVKTTN